MDHPIATTTEEIDSALDAALAPANQHQLAHAAIKVITKLNAAGSAMFGQHLRDMGVLRSVADTLGVDEGATHFAFDAAMTP